MCIRKDAEPIAPAFLISRQLLRKSFGREDQHAEACQHLIAGLEGFPLLSCNLQFVGVVHSPGGPHYSRS